MDGERRNLAFEQGPRKENKYQLDHPGVSHIDAHHGLASIGFTHSALVLEYKQMRLNR